MFDISLYISLSLVLAGVLLQIFKLNKTSSARHKLKNLKFNIIPGLLNTIFQTKLFKASKIRWAVHFLVFTGFIFLLLFHALDELISMKLFSSYEPTVDPYQFLRNFAGFLVAVGCIGFLIKKFNRAKSDQRIKGEYNNLFSIFFILLIICSGFMLETSKIISEPIFMEMVEDYAGIDEDSGLDDLKAFWGKNYNVVFEKALISSEEALEEGEILNEDFCLDCHSKISSAFVSNILSNGLKKRGSVFNHFRADRFLYHIHYLLCFLGLISLPFSRLFHIFLIPFASLKQQADVKTFQNRDIVFNSLTLAGCTDCRICSDVCSVYPNFVITDNIKVLPHYKINAFKKIISGTHLDLEELNRIKISNDECTRCNNCTDICPSNIDLQSLWEKLSYTLNQTIPETTDRPDTMQFTKGHDILFSPTSFKNCVQCTICTNVCPVVGYCSNSENDMTPQQIMNLLRLGKKQMAAKTQMVNNCLTCYSCQESCPSEIKVTDILIELRQAATKC